MNTLWYKGKRPSAKSKQELQAKLANAADAFEELHEVLELQIKDRATEADYDNPSWSHKQAHQNGFNEALRLVMKLTKD